MDMMIMEALAMVDTVIPVKATVMEVDMGMMIMVVMVIAVAVTAIAVVDMVIAVAVVMAMAVVMVMVVDMMIITDIIRCYDSRQSKKLSKLAVFPHTKNTYFSNMLL